MTAPVHLVGDRIHLREFTAADLDALHSIVGDDRLTRFMAFDSLTREQADAMLTGILDRARTEPRTDYYLAAARPDTDEPVGFARLTLGGVQAADLGYAIAHDHQGHGYATDAVRTAVAFAFGSLGLHRITAAIGPENTASMTVVQRCGFTREGVLRHHVHTNGAWRDSVLFSLLEPSASRP